MQQAFPLFEKWGVAGVKIDFINRDDQQGIQWYYDVAKLAAEHHLMVDFHGTRTPWGLERTYPNVLSYEGVLGMENNKVGRRDSPTDRSVFPFTRLLAGPDRPTAVVAGSDVLAAACYTVASRQGLRIGRDLAVTGFDGSVISRLLTPALTTVAMPLRNLAGRLIDRVTEEVTGSGPGHGEFLQTILVPGESA